ncbi:MAG: tRNA uridine-5-carboxymethylaminomethyl(34) synthesis GTPase MnmE [Chloroflexota bacterium]
MDTDAIVAIVPPPGEGGVGIVRASGPQSESLASALFPTLRVPWPSHRMRHGNVIDPATGTPIDSALGCFMRAPHSYTGEDVFEIQCHGSPLVLERVMQSCLRHGCRAARPGEFTLRAFLNGRIDLSQAEAVLDVVRARSNMALELAVRQLSGWLTERIEPLRDVLIGALAHIEAMVDFVEDDIPPHLDATTRERLESVLQATETLLEGSAQGILLREGATLAIVGSPNVGKSSIMNSLLGLERSIVTPVAGTTRDTVEETMQVGGIAFRTVDTAGITRTDDVVEQIGIDRSRKALESANIVLLVLDGSRPHTGADDLVIHALEEARAAHNGEAHNQRVLVAVNKSDLPARLDPAPIIDRLTPHAVVGSNAVTLDGVEALRSALAGAALGDTRHEVVVGNVRHQNALRVAADALRAALDGLGAGTPLDLISFDVRAAAIALSEITGASVDDELLDRIFRDFCIGK